MHCHASYTTLAVSGSPDLADDQHSQDSVRVAQAPELADDEVRAGLASIRRRIDIERVQDALDRLHPRRRRPHRAACYAVLVALQQSTLVRVEMRTFASRSGSDVATVHRSVRSILDLGVIKTTESKLERVPGPKGGFVFRATCLTYLGGLVWSKHPALEVRESDRTLWSLVIKARTLGIPESVLVPMARTGKTRKLSALLSTIKGLSEEDEPEPCLGFNYSRYLASRRWAILREAVRARARGMCERVCGHRMTQVHHLTYERVGREDLEDLLGICGRCHEYLSGKSNADPVKWRGDQAIPRSRRAAWAVTDHLKTEI